MHNGIRSTTYDDANGNTELSFIGPFIKFIESTLKYSDTANIINRHVQFNIIRLQLYLWIASKQIESIIYKYNK